VDCLKAQRLVDAYADGELDVATAVDLEEHLETCPECSWAYESRIGLRSAMRGADLGHRTPAGLEARVRAAVRSAADEDRANASDAREPSVAPVVRWPRAWLVATAASLVVAAAAITIAWREAAMRPGDEVARDAVASHVRSLMADHLMDVPSSDQHTVKPWFDGKVDFAPPVVDLADRDFTLAGGRLDYLDDSPAAALVYTRRRHVVNLFIQPSSGPEAERVEVYKGYNVVRWASASMAYCAVSDLNAAELREFAEAIRSRVDAPTTP
jgi:anti-sigma factor RsiW